MKKLSPLKQFVCDTCGEIIKSPEEGWLEWIYDSKTKKAHSFRLCHHVTASPLGRPTGCYQHSGSAGCSDMHLDAILEHRMAHLLQFIDVGDYHEPEFKGPHASNLREWAEMARRLTIPYYEQARLYWNKAIGDDHFGGANEIKVYTEEFLKNLVGEYAE